MNAPPKPFQAEAFPYGHYRAIHRHLFQDVYTWAGKIRSVRISKGESRFCLPENINREMKKLFKQLADAKYFRSLDAKEFASRTAHFLAYLNAIHPFREGNGRSQLSFLVMLAERAGHPLDLLKMKPERVMEAVIASFDGNEGPLAELILSSIDNKR